jgi:N-methyl-L-proline demethylase
VPYVRAFNETETRITLNQRVCSVRRITVGGALGAVHRLEVELGSDHSTHRSYRVVDAVVFDRGVAANDELYRALVPASVNAGAVDHLALVDRRPQPRVENDRRFQLFRIGDAVAGRNIHAAVYDALRLCHTL